MKSKKPSKARKNRANAPLHRKQNMLASPLSKELRNKYGKRSLQIRKGDKVRIMRGDHKGAEGEMEKANLNKGKIYITGIKAKKTDGTEKPKPIDPSNVMITELELSDKKRIVKIKRDKK